jgi:hypothetical protein
MKRYLLAVWLMALAGVLSLSAQSSGYIVSGWTMNNTTGPAGADWDFTLVRLDEHGNLQWQKNYGGTMQEHPFSLYGFPSTNLIPTSDGGHLLFGQTLSYVHGTLGRDYDILLYKLDAGGKKLWRKNLGGMYWDFPKTVFQTADGGYLVAGQTMSFVHGTPNSDFDFLLYKLDAAGNKQWRKNFGGVGHEFLSTVEATPDGGYVLVGATASFTNGGFDFLVYKIDGAGKKQWRKNYGGVGIEPLLFPYQDVRLAQTSEGGYALAGSTSSYYHGTSGDTDFLVYKLDGAGKKQWRRNFGGIYNEGSIATVEFQQTADGGYALAGSTASFVHGTSPGDIDFLVYKLDASGKKQWRKNYGGLQPEPYPLPFSKIEFQQTADGGYTLAGSSLSYYSGPSANPDFLVYKIDGAGNKQWRGNFGGGYYEPPPIPEGQEFRLKPTSDGGYVLAGTSWSYGMPGLASIVVYKLDASGGLEWREIIGDYYSDVFGEIYEITN